MQVVRGCEIRMIGKSRRDCLTEMMDRSLKKSGILKIKTISNRNEQSFDKRKNGEIG